MKLKYFFTLLVAFVVPAVCDDSVKCKRELIDSHNIMSYPDPQKGKLILCPHIKQSCIPSFEQFKMFAWYSTTVKPHYDLSQEVIKIELKLLNDLFKVVIPNMLTKVVSAISDENARIQAIDMLERLKKKKIDKIMKTAISEHANSQSYMQTMKTAYFCAIGDFNSHRYIDTVRQRYSMTDSSCDDLVKNTLVFANAVNRGILPFLESLLTVHYKIVESSQGGGKGDAGSSPNIPKLRLVGSGHISKATKECADQFKVADESLSSCKKYCSHFRLNADSPAFEGYPEFFSRALSELMSYGPNPSGTPAPKSRILGEKMAELLKSRRRLEESGEPAEKFDSLDPDKILPIDLFEENSIDPDFDDAAMIEAFKVQQLLTKGEAFDPTTVVRKHYIDEYEVPMDDLESNSVFNLPSAQRVDVTNFAADVLVAGIDFPTIIKELNWNMTIDEIAKALVTGKRGGQKELVDPALIMAINEIDNTYVKKFHNDPLLSFKKIWFQYRIKQLKQNALDQLNNNFKSADETMLIVTSAVKDNVDDPEKASKIILDVKTKLLDNGDASLPINESKESVKNALNPADPNGPVTPAGETPVKEEKKEVPPGDAKPEIQRRRK